MKHIRSACPLELAQYLAQDFATRATEADVQGAMPLEDVEALKASGYLGISVPKEYGGQGLSLQDCVAAQLELAQGSASTAIVAGMTIHIFGHIREVQRWPEAVYARFCREIVEEGAIFNAVASEPILGSPSRGGLPDSYVAEHPDGWRVKGHKTWVTGGRHLTHMLVSVRIEDDPAVVVVKQDATGVEWHEVWRNALSLRASDSHDVYFNDVVVPPDHLIERGKSEGPAMPSVWFPTIMASIYLGSALAARNAIIKYALERVPSALGKPISTLPKIQRQIGELDISLQAARTLLLQAAADWTGDHETRKQRFPQIVAAKHLAVETANQVTDRALEIAGGQALANGLPLERFFRDVRAGRMQPPAGDTALEIVGRHAIAGCNRG